MNRKISTGVSPVADEVNVIILKSFFTCRLYLLFELGNDHKVRWLWRYATCPFYSVSRPIRLPLLLLPSQCSLAAGTGPCGFGRSFAVAALNEDLHISTFDLLSLILYSCALHTDTTRHERVRREDGGFRHRPHRDSYRLQVHFHPSALHHRQ